MSETPHFAINVRHLTKQYGDFLALNNLDLTVAYGEFFGFLGPNGAGKTTLIKILTTLMAPSTGEAWVGEYRIGDDDEAIRSHIGVALQDVGVDPLLTGRENLLLQCRLFGLSPRQSQARVDELLDQFGLTTAQHQRLRTYSGGMRRRLDLALALVHKPLILFLDEPTTGLDPTNRFMLWDLLRQLNHDAGITIFLTTQYLEEADVLCNRVAFMRQGQIVAEDTPSHLKQQLGHDVVTFSVPSPDHIPRIEQWLQKSNMLGSVTGQRVRMTTRDTLADVAQTTMWLQSANISVEDFHVSSPSLDDVFLAVTNSPEGGIRHAQISE
ncbi:MAG: ABC transporter ATP-binding protein [Sulfobacillus thermotolerans]|uniref:ABC transporter domain-containing protein n=1 Tax=Sulfobacillus thermotolerans TaxID=338644 RepID=A0ABN5H0H6_9FIRM|nr:hypothetical protein BXT84_09555 [Sulfobacillus thermotolerans]MCY0908164.1 ABC transporter ATP-binding protein [Sulfobacillus thermotolerans]